uniref:Uncharacterized protein n=1 Tax=Anopheles atroparvus TaxID=41427 RepID=A0A182JBT0_ANOAO
MELLKSVVAAAGQQPRAPSNVLDEMWQEIDKMDPYAETITLTYHLRQFAKLFLRRVNDDQTLNAIFAHLNEAALADNKFAVKMATVFGSRQLGDVVIQETKIRNAMIGTLQQNFLTIERLKQTDVQRFYNSVTLLGEYYNRKKMLNGRRINILGQSLLLLLTSELEQEITKCTVAQHQQQSPHQMDAEFAKLLLEQITLNGAVAKDEHRKEITDLLYTIRKALITVPNLCVRAKAFLLMALDLHHSNLAEDLFAKLYNKYLTEPQQAEEVRTNGSGEPVETVRVEQPDESKQPVDGCIVRTEEKLSPDAAATPKATGIRANSIPRGTGGKTSSPQHNHTAHDKENKRRPSSRAGAAPDKKPTGPTQTGKRNVRVGEDGKLVATITRDAPVSPTKKTPPSPTTVGGIRAERSPGKKGLSPRMERLAALPKITITCSTPSPKRQGGNTAATSPRAVLGVATAKQQQQHPKQPPKSPIGTAAPKSVPEVPKSPEGNSRSAKVSSPSNGREPVDTNKTGKVQRSEVNNAPSTERGPDGKEAVKHHENGTTTQKISPPAAASKHTNGKDKSPHVTNGAEKEPPARDNVVSKGTGVDHYGTGKRESVQEASEGATKPTVKPNYREDQEEEEEEELENLSWNAMMALDDDSPQKLNPHTKSFLSFLADK